MRITDVRNGQRVRWPNPEALGGTRCLEGTVLERRTMVTGHERVKVQPDRSPHPELISASRLRPA